MSFGISFLKQRQPSLVLAATLGKVERSRPCLVSLAILLFSVQSVDLYPSSFFIDTLIPISLSQIKLVINDGLDPFAIYCRLAPIVMGLKNAKRNRSFAQKNDALKSNPRDVGINWSHDEHNHVIKAISELQDPIFVHKQRLTAITLEDGAIVRNCLDQPL